MQAVRSQLLGALALASLLAGCATSPPPGRPAEVPAPPQPSVSLPSKPATPTRLRTHPRFAPPPDVPSYWDTRLGVYVLQDRPQVFYRERVYYRWGAGWSSASHPEGPWRPVDSSNVPAGLSRHFAQ